MQFNVKDEAKTGEGKKCLICGDEGISTREFLCPDCHNIVFEKSRIAQFCTQCRSLHEIPENHPMIAGKFQLTNGTKLLIVSPKCDFCYSGSLPVNADVYLVKAIGST
ncbi:MAG: hypothetical protein NTZ49_05470 [Candidatus Parcubacteria bacterium]|nr:hypothetical protein [Candidatus Parcubacteria bacterium]